MNWVPSFVLFAAMALVQVGPFNAYPLAAEEGTNGELTGEAYLSYRNDLEPAGDSDAAIDDVGNWVTTRVVAILADNPDAAARLRDLEQAEVHGRARLDGFRYVMQLSDWTDEERSILYAESLLFDTLQLHESWSTSLEQLSYGERKAFCSALRGLLFYAALGKLGDARLDEVFGCLKKSLPRRQRIALLARIWRRWGRNVCGPMVRDHVYRKRVDADYVLLLAEFLMRDAYDMDEMLVGSDSVHTIVSWPGGHTSEKSSWWTPPEESSRGYFGKRAIRLRQLFGGLNAKLVGHRLLARGIVDALARLAQQNCDTEAGLTQAGYPPVVPFRQLLGQLRDVLSEKGFDGELADIERVIADVDNYTPNPSGLYRPPPESYNQPIMKTVDELLEMKKAREAAEEQKRLEAIAEQERREQRKAEP